MVDQPDDAVTKLQEIKADRFQVLNYVYEASDGSPHVLVTDHEICKALGMNEQKVRNILSYLTIKNFVGGPIGGASSITNGGIDAVEATGKRTEHFPAAYVTNFNAVVSNLQFQQGTHNSTQTGEFSSFDLNSIRAFTVDLMTQLGQLELPDDQRDELRADLASVKIQLESPNPKWPIIGGLFTSVRGVLENAGGEIAADFVRQIDSLPL